MKTWSFWISIAAILIAGVSAYFACKQHSLASKQAHQHIDPIVKTNFDLPEEKNPVFVISNEGDISVVSVSVGNRFFVFNKNTEKVTGGEMSRLFSPGAIYREILKPAEYESMELIKVTPKEHFIVIYEFSIKYFRDKDMKEYTSNEYFFIDGFDLVNHADFMQNNFYKTIMSAITNYKFPSQTTDPGALREYLDANTDKQ